MKLNYNGRSGLISVWGIALLFTLFGSDRESHGEILFDASVDDIPAEELIRWIPAIIAGPVDPDFAPHVEGAPANPLSGLCMYAPLGDSVLQRDNHMVGWMRQVGAGGTIGLLDRTAWEVKATLNSNITDLDKTPWFYFSYDNSVIESPAPGAPLEMKNQAAFFGEHAILDTSGGANKIGSPGRDEFCFWVTPAPVELDQWRGDGSSTAAFATTVDDCNDINIGFRLFDVDEVIIVAWEDVGTVCVEKIEITSTPLSTFTSTSEGLTLGTSTFAKQTFDEEQQTTDCLNAFGIDDEMCSLIDSGSDFTYELSSGDNPQASDSIKTLLAFDPAGGSTIQHKLNPIVWVSESLYSIQYDVRLSLGPNGTIPTGNDPVDVIEVLGVAPTIELQSGNYVLSDRGGAFEGLGSPDLGTSPQWFTGLFFSHSKTLSTAPGFDRWTPQLKFLNGNPAYRGQGRDPMTVHGISVNLLTLP